MSASILFLACLTCGGDPLAEYGEPAVMRGGLMLRAPGMAPAEAPAVPAPKVVDLSWPGALERLARENPAHHRTAEEVIKAAAAHACDGAVNVARGRPELADPTCVDHRLLPNYPARRLLGFTLGGTKYLAYLGPSTQ